MLQYDALDALAHSLIALREEDHRLSARLFRDSWETLELASYFAEDSRRAQRDLEKWYNDEVIPHSRIREDFKIRGAVETATEKAIYYSQLSKFTHRTCRALLKGYSIGRDNLVVNESHSRRGSLASPHAIAGYYPVLASLIMRFSSDVVNCGLAPQSEVDAIGEASLEKETVQYRFHQPTRDR